ncbi:MAG: transposase [[Eubacterium] siraeum]
MREVPDKISVPKCKEWKTVRHIWSEYIEMAEDIGVPEYKAIYTLRKETIERVFADAKEKHSMIYSFRGLPGNEVRLKFVAMNLKNMRSILEKAHIFPFFAVIERDFCAKA